MEVFLVWGSGVTVKASRPPPPTTTTEQVTGAAMNCAWAWPAAPLNVVIIPLKWAETRQIPTIQRQNVAKRTVCLFVYARRNDNVKKFRLKKTGNWQDLKANNTNLAVPHDWSWKYGWWWFEVEVRLNRNNLSGRVQDEKEEEVAAACDVITHRR